MYHLIWLEKENIKNGKDKGQDQLVLKEKDLLAFRSLKVLWQNEKNKIKSD